MTVLQDRIGIELQSMELRTEEANNNEQEVDIAIMVEEARTHDARKIISHVECKEEITSLNATIASHTLRVMQLKSELALRPPMEVIPMRRHALENQVVKLSVELANTKDRVALHHDTRAAVDRCQELRDSIAHFELQVAEQEKSIVECARDENDAKIALAAWMIDERPRHEMFYSKLISENQSITADIEEFEKKLAEISRIRAYHDRCRNQWRVEEEAWSAGLVTDSDECEIYDSSSSKLSRFTFEVVEGSGKSERTVQALSVLKPEILTYPAIVMDTAGALQPLGTEDASHSKHFHFFTIRVVQSVLGFLTRHAVNIPQSHPQKNRLPENVQVV